jgi:hypothetical protein
MYPPCKRESSAQVRMGAPKQWSLAQSGSASGLGPEGREFESLISDHLRSFIMSGKGSKPRPFSVNQEVFDNNWDRIFKKEQKWDHYSDLPNPDSYKNEYQDILSTEDCILDAFDLEDPDRVGN